MNDTRNAMTTSLPTRLLSTLRQRLQTELAAHGLDAIAVPAHPHAFRLIEDPSDGSLAVEGEWLDPQGQRVGFVLVRDDGPAYAELDVLRPLPTDLRYFVDSVIAWGDGECWKAELQLVRTLS